MKRVLELNPLKQLEVAHLSNKFGDLEDSNLDH
jgi:hypothetical protein